MVCLETPSPPTPTSCSTNPPRNCAVLGRAAEEPTGATSEPADRPNCTDRWSSSSVPFRMSRPPPRQSRPWMRSLLGCEVRTSRSRRGGGHPKTLRLTSGPNSSGVVNQSSNTRWGPSHSGSNSLYPLFNTTVAAGAAQRPPFGRCWRRSSRLRCRALRNTRLRTTGQGHRMACRLRCALLTSPLVHGSPLHLVGEEMLNFLIDYATEGERGQCPAPP